jgi:NADH-quinone oxidoreductase subunit I
MTVRDFLKKVFLVEIIKGMALTLRSMFSHAVTRQYPEEKREVFAGFRGRHAFVRDPDTGREKCVICLKCAVICPSQCINISYKTVDGKRVLENYEIESLRCIFCGYCVEVCPVCALVLTEFYEYSDFNKNNFLFNRERLLKNWDDFVATLETDEYFNKFWRPPGINIKRMAVRKRLQGPIPIRQPLSKNYKAA